MITPADVVRDIVIVPFDPAWPAAYRGIALQLSDELGADLCAIHHIGSTAISGTRSKPTIDVLVEVYDIVRMDAHRAGMFARGYEWGGEFGINGRRFFIRRSGGIHTEHIHVFQRGHERIAAHLDFRDYLNANPQCAERYARLKEALAAEFRNDIAGYADAKSEFINSILGYARDWRSEGRM